MSWHKITLKLLPEIDPQVVEIGKLGWEVFERENKPAGFAMLHATRASENDMDDKFLVYLSPSLPSYVRKSQSATHSNHATSRLAMSLMPLGFLVTRS